MAPRSSAPTQSPISQSPPARSPAACRSHPSHTPRASTSPNGRLLKEGRSSPSDRPFVILGFPTSAAKRPEATTAFSVGATFVWSACGSASSALPLFELVFEAVEKLYPARLPVPPWLWFMAISAIESDAPSSDHHETDRRGQAGPENVVSIGWSAPCSDSSPRVTVRPLWPARGLTEAQRRAGHGLAARSLPAPADGIRARSAA